MFQVLFGPVSSHWQHWSLHKFRDLVFGFGVMRMRHVLLCIGLASAIATGALGADDWVTVKP